MPKPDRVVTEQEHHRKAFEVYLALGEKRTYRAVAAQLGVSVSTIKLWSRTYGWPARLRERDAQLAREIADRTRSDGIVGNERHLRIVRAALIRLAKGIAEGKIRMQLSDVDRMIRLERELSGADRDPTEASSRPYGAVLILPDNGRDPAFRPPVFVMPDNGSSPPSDAPEADSHDDQS
jgi:hypothetical protein